MSRISAAVLMPISMVAGMLVSESASADSWRMCSWGGPTSYYDVGTLSVGTLKLTHTFPKSPNWSPLDNLDYTLFKSLDTAMKGLNTDLANDARTIIGQYGLNYESSNIGYSGSVGVTLGPGTSATLSGLKLNFSVTASTYEGPLKITCNVNGSATPTLTGTINTSNGQIPTLTVKGNTGNVGVSDHCSTNLSIIDPLVNGLLGIFLPVDDLDARLSNLTFSVTLPNNATGIEGLAQSFPSGYFVSQGVDYGAQIANSIRSMSSVSFTFTRFNSLDYPASSYPMNIINPIMDDGAYVYKISDPATIPQTFMTVSVPNLAINLSMVNDQYWDTVYCSQVLPGDQGNK